MSSAVVVGAGVFGASIAHRLAADGWQVTLIERDEPAGPRSTSGSHSRVLRCGHGTDVWHARLARRARDLWREIERESGTALLEECGVLWLAGAQDAWASDSERVLRELAIPVEHLEPAAAGALFPSFDPNGLAFAVLEPESGVLRARRGVHALTSLALEHGARMVRGTAIPGAGGTVDVDGTTIEGDAVVWACGPWLTRLFPGLVDLRVDRVEYATFECGPGWSAADGVPAYVEMEVEVYGLPDLDDEGFKVAPEPPPDPYDPDTAERPLTAAAEADARTYLARRFPALAGAPRRGGRVCQYETTPDSEFILAPHPADGHVWLAGGGSGHGFKHGPALAEHVRDLLTGAAAPLSRHGLEPRAPRDGLMFGPGAQERNH